MNGKVLWSLCGGVVLASAAMLGAPGFTGEAKAQQYACDGRPNEVFVVRWPGGNGVAPVDLCYEDYPEEQPSQHSQTVSHPADSLAAVSEGYTIVIDGLLKLMADPELMAFQTGGVWKYSSDPKSCKAAFLNPNGIMAVFAPTADFSGITTLYQSDSVPQAKAPKQVTVDLEELDPATGAVILRMTTPAIHDENSIIVIYNGKDYAVFLKSIKDNARYKVYLNGKQVFDLTMRDGLEAKKSLQACKPS